MKSFFFLIFFVLTLYIAIGQTSKDYYIPSSSYNESLFYTPDKSTGEQTGLTRQIYFIKKGKKFDIVDAKLSQGKPSSIITRTVQFVGNEIKMSQSISSGLIETNKKIIYSTPITIFRVPLSGKETSWTILDNADGYINYTSAWTNVTIDNKLKKAIKVIQTIPSLNSKIIEYYVFGIGLWKTDIQTSGKTYIYEKLDKLDFDPSVSNSSTSQNDNPYHNSSLIAKYERSVISGEVPSDPNVQTKYDDRDYRAIIWSDKLSNASDYSPDNIEKLGYVYVKISFSDNDHINYLYRNCKKNLLLNVTEWYSMKLAIDIQWYSDAVKHSIGNLMICD